jgi:hypothetical protein
VLEIEEVLLDTGSAGTIFVRICRDFLVKSQFHINLAQLEANSSTHSVLRFTKNGYDLS